MEALGSHRRNFVVGSHTTGDFSDGAVVPIQCLGAKNDWLPATTSQLARLSLHAGKNYVVALATTRGWASGHCYWVCLRALACWLLSRVAFQAGHSDGQQRGGRG